MKRPTFLLITTDQHRADGVGCYGNPYVRTPHLDRMAAEGVRLRLRGEDGTRHDVVDAMSSWWSVIHGYRHPVLDAAARGQLDRFSHVMFGGLTHAPAVELAERHRPDEKTPPRHLRLRKEDDSAA